MTGDDLAPRQHAALLAFGRHVERHGGAPTIRELGDALDVTSTNAVCELLAALRRKGYVVRQPLVSRGHRLTSLGRSLLARYGIAAEHTDRRIEELLDAAEVPAVPGDTTHRIVVALERLVEYHREEQRIPPSRIGRDAPCPPSRPGVRCCDWAGGPDSRDGSCQCPCHAIGGHHGE